jgi:hypothetical protein
MFQPAISQLQLKRSLAASMRANKMLFFLAQPVPESLQLQRG